MRCFIVASEEHDDFASTLHIPSIVEYGLEFESHSFLAQNTITMQGTIYDHSPTKNADFEYNIGDDRNLVQTTIGTDRRPVYAPSGATNTVHGSSTFYQVNTFVVINSLTLISGSVTSAELRK